MKIILLEGVNPPLDGKMMNCPQPISMITIQASKSHSSKTPKSEHCKVEFNQPSCWLYFVPNLLVFQQLVTLYLGGILVRVVSEIVCKKKKDLRLDLVGGSQLQAARSYTRARRARS